MATSHMADQLGRVLGGRYRLIAPIGSGASAQVYLADDVALRRRVAVKLLHPALADDAAFLRRFRAEARAAAALSHPHIMAVYDWDDADNPYLVLEFLGGGSLRSMLDEGHRLTLSQTLLIGLEAARALDFAHRRGFVHRDIKPANLLFDEEGRLRIADFGLARALAEAAWTEPQGALVGTARYAAPEQALGQNVDGRADVYSLGLVLIEAVTGTVPFAADTQIATLMARTEKPVEVPDALGPLAPAIAVAGRVDPADRCDAAELGKRLLAAARELDTPQPLPLAGAVDMTGVRALADADPTLLPPRSNDEPTTIVPRDPTTVVAPTTATTVVAPTVGVTALFGDDGGEIDGPPTRHRRRWWKVALLVLFLAAAGAGGAWAWTVSQTAKAPVPRLVDLTRETAQQRIAAAQRDGDLRWRLRVEERNFENVKAGVVADQRPDAGVELEDEGTLTIVVSLGPPPRVVPGDLPGLTLDEARAAIEGADLAVGALTEVFSEDLEPGRVVDATSGGQPLPRELPKGSPIDLAVSRGPEPRLVPALAGAGFDEAKAELEELGLVAQRDDRFSNSVPVGQVIGTEPGEGATVERGTTVVLAVSKGPDLVTVPDLKGKKLDDANALLRAAGLVPGELAGEAEGKVIATSPEAGKQVARGTRVKIFLD